MENVKREVVEVLKSKAGLDPAAAQRAVDVVIEHFKQNPGRIAELLGLGGLGNFGGIFGGGAPNTGSTGGGPRRGGNSDVI